MKLKLILITALILALVVHEAYACGCGIAITNMKVFNALKETQAYLLIDVKNQTAYDEMPFFRFVSMNRSYDVSIVFPIDQVPYDVQGKKITADEFLNNYGISNAESYMKKQDVVELAKSINKPLFMMSNGFIPVLSYAFSASSFSTAGAMMKQGPLAHFEFEGGTLDIYDVSSAQTLDEFVKSVGIELEGQVKDLVEKYKDYYVAVLRLRVPSLISEDKMSLLESCAPRALELVQNELKTESEITFYELERRAMSVSNCGGQANEYLAEYIQAATYMSGNLNGTLVTMKFNNGNFFYPTSIVNSYKYPIADQKYFVRTPEDLNIQLSSSSISSVANFQGSRWYKVGSIEQDLKGKIVQSDFVVRMDDGLRNMVMKVGENPLGLILILYVLILALPLVAFRKSEKIASREIATAIGTYVVGGLILTSILFYAKKKKNVALVFILIWAAMLILFLSAP
jgi:hypothetical protein